MPILIGMVDGRMVFGKKILNVCGSIFFNHKLLAGTWNTTLIYMFRNPA